MNPPQSLLIVIEGDFYLKEELLIIFNPCSRAIVSRGKTNKYFSQCHTIQSCGSRGMFVTQPSTIILKQHINLLLINK